MEYLHYILPFPMPFYLEFIIPIWHEVLWVVLDTTRLEPKSWSATQGNIDTSWITLSWSLNSSLHRWPTFLINSYEHQMTCRDIELPHTLLNSLHTSVASLILIIGNIIETCWPILSSHLHKPCWHEWDVPSHLCSHPHTHCKRKVGVG